MSGRTFEDDIEPTYGIDPEDTLPEPPIVSEEEARAILADPIKYGEKLVANMRANARRRKAKRAAVARS